MSTPMKKYYVEMDAFESGLREIEHEGGDYYKVEEVDARIAELERENQSMRADWKAIRDAAESMPAGTVEFQLRQRIAELEKALREIAALDYKNAATNGAAYEAVQIASRSLMDEASR